MTTITFPTPQPPAQSESEQYPATRLRANSSCAHSAGSLPQTAAHDHKADLIILGAQGAGAMTGLASRFLGGTAYEVCCNAKCPLLIVPEAH
ncbi:MAG: universal stress protein [Acidobacteriaceae bacterium]